MIEPGRRYAFDERRPTEFPSDTGFMGRMPELLTANGILMDRVPCVKARAVASLTRR